MPAEPDGKMPHVPAGFDPNAVHCSHAAPHPVAQQTPSARLPLAHAFAVVELWPFFRPQALLPLHVEFGLLAQSPCGSLPASVALHVPLAPPVSEAAQAWHEPQLGVEQQTPSTQPPFRHSWHPPWAQSAGALDVPTLHVAPVAFCAWHVLSEPQ